MLNLNANDFTRANHILSLFEFYSKKFGYDEVFTETLGAYSPIFDQDALKIMAPTGEILTLKNDPTPLVTKQMAPFCKGYKKCYYKSTTTLLDPSGPNGIREKLFGGIEYFGNTHVESDVEVLFLTLSVLNALGIHNIKVDIGDIAFSTLFLLEKGIDIKKHPHILRSLSKRSHTGTEEMTNEERNHYRSLIELNGSSKHVFSVLEQMELSESVLSILNRSKQLIQLLEQRTENAFDIGLDYTMAHPRPYYSGALYKIYAIDTGKTIVKGGRYDLLSREYGFDFPACGLAMDIKNILEVMNMKNKQCDNTTDFALVYGQNALKEAIELSDWLLENGFSVKLNEKPKDFVSALKTEYYQSVKTILECENGSYKVLDQVKNESYRLTRETLKQKLSLEYQFASIH